MAAVAAVALYVARDSLVDALSNFAGEKGEEASIVMIDGEEYEYTGTNHRVLLFKVYREAFERIGTFGYGFELRRMPLDEDLALRFGSIDNHYILFFLRNGYPGLITFAALTITTILSLARLAWNVEDGRSVLAAGLCGALVGIGVTLFSVWMAPSFGQAWLFCAGLAGNLRMLKGDVREPAVHRPSHPAIAGRRKPWPGLAPQHTL
jgi:O-antigen ligase